MSNQVQLVQLDQEEFKQSIINALKEALIKEIESIHKKQNSDYMSRHELAEWLKIDLSTIHNWSKSGKIKAYRLGNRVYYKREEIEAAMQPLKPSKKHSSATNN